MKESLKVLQECAEVQTKKSNELIADLMVEIRNDLRKIELGIERRIRESLSVIDPVIESVVAPVPVTVKVPSS